jgi:hypothetical protein
MDKVQKPSDCVCSNPLKKWGQILQEWLYVYTTYNQCSLQDARMRCGTRAHDS